MSAIKQLDVNNERGAVMVVEAALVYPIVVFVVIIFVVLGNMFYQQSQVDSAVVRAAEKLAAYYTDPTLINGVPTNSENMEVYPYRYLLGCRSAEEKAESFLCEELEEIGEGFFSGMGIDVQSVDCHIENYAVYQTANVQVEYTIDFFPMELLGAESTFHQSVATSIAAPDPAEFIRNIDMVLDYAEQNDWLNKMQTAVDTFMGN